MASTTKSKTVIIWILGALATVTPFAIDLYLPAFAQLAQEFNTTTARVSFSVSSYFIGMAIGQMLYGPLLDRFGRKRPLYVGMIVFIVASFGCMQSTNIELMIVFRFIQALGGSVAWVGAVAMVRDFFPVEQSANKFSLLVLIIGVSPLLAPTVGGFITVAWGWKAVFMALIAIAALILTIVFIYLPEGRRPDPTVSLGVGPMIVTFMNVLKVPQFYTYSLVGAFSFATLFIYVAGSPVVFMEYYKVSPQVYGGIFALLSVGFIGASQMNILLTRKYGSDKILKYALMIQVVISLLFLICVLSNVLDLYSTIFMFFICLSCVGTINPNANALALSPFERNIGSASALMGCTQIGIAALASSGVGLFESTDTLPVATLFAITSSIAATILYFGSRRVGPVVMIAGDTAGVGVH